MSSRILAVVAEVLAGGGQLRVPVSRALARCLEDVGVVRAAVLLFEPVQGLSWLPLEGAPASGSQIEPVVRAHARTARTRLLSRDRDVDAAPLLDGFGVDCVLLVPLTHDERPIGALVGVPRADTVFDDKACARVEAEAPAVALALLMTIASEAQLLMADRLVSVGALAAGVAHEINNPLATVIANLDMAQDEVKALPAEHVSIDLRDELADASEAADRVRQIVRDLRMFSRAEEDRRGPVDLRTVLESSLRLTWNEIRHRARLVKLFDHVPPVEANEARLCQVFLNLVLNAAQAIPEGRAAENQIRVILRSEGTHSVAVEVTDTGCGMSAEAQRHVFTPFFTTKTRTVGTGLGLTTSQRIVTALGGELRFASTEGVGSTFTVILPLAQGSAKAASPAAIQTGPVPPGGRPLVVDEDPTPSG